MDFIKSIEKPSFEYLNREINENIIEIKKGKFNSIFYDPCFIISENDLSALYFDAINAKRMKHYLTLNHKYILLKFNEITEQEVKNHNNEWEENNHGIPRVIVKEEQLLRGKKKISNNSNTLAEEYPDYYKVDRFLLFRDNYSYNPDIPF